MKLYLKLFCLVFATGTATANDNYICYHWSIDDIAVMGSGMGHAVVEKPVCESYDGNIFTQGYNDKYPNCGDCWCCKPKVYECHHWTKEDRAVFGPTPTPAQERARCEDDLGFIFTQGANDNFPGAGGCWCIKPKAEKLGETKLYECHHWTKEDRAVFGPTPTPAQERARCEDDLGFIFTQGVNDNFPGAGGCWCIKPKAEKLGETKLYECHHWTKEDRAVFGPTPTPAQERARCEDDLGFIFTQGVNDNFPGAGGCWCIKPKAEKLGETKLYECYHWTKEDRAVFGPTPTPAQERARCEDDLGFIFTQGVNDNFPGAGGCWCIKPKDEKTVYECYHWTEEDMAVLGSKPTPAQERARCENELGFIFTQGVNDDFPGAGGCWCIKPKDEKTVYECYHWTEEDRAVFGPTPTPAQERARCEDDLGFIFTQGVNDNFPGAGGCWCIKPKAEKLGETKLYECYHWTKEDRAVFGPTPTPAQERARCEDDLGFIFTQGVNDDFSGAGGCWCIKPKA